MKLAKIVKIAPQFQRSVRIDLDFGREDALRAYVFQPSARAAIQSVARYVRESSTCAFTFTGPFGGGKSSLALILASRLASTPSIRMVAAKRLGKETNIELNKAINCDGKRWDYVPLVGSRRDLVASVWEQLESLRLIRTRSANRSAGALIEALLQIASRPTNSGLLLVVDELGKHLEHAAREGGDIFFLQQIAEAANRSNRRLIFVGILHQAFDQYASRLGRDTKDEWAKIQGRFTDIPIITPVDEVIELVGQAVLTNDAPHRHTADMARAVADEIRKNRPGYSDDLWRRLDRCWPLHPATAALVGPISRRRFSQNERSVFSFLGSAEPLGFREFIDTTEVAAKQTFAPARYWDYLRANLEPSILASPDGHRWAQAAEAVSRSEAKGGHLHIDITKTVALIDLFKNGSGLSATNEVVAQSVQGSGDDVRRALRELNQWAVIAHRKHIDAWVIHEGSDFDVDRAVDSILSGGIEFTLDRLAMLTNLQPILAKRLYHETGTLRWFLAEVCPLEETEKLARQFSGDEGAAGKFLLALPSKQEALNTAKLRARDASKLASNYPVAVGVAENVFHIRDLGYELLALEALQRKYPEIEGDAVARREITARISRVSSVLEEELRRAFLSCKWFVHGDVRTAKNDMGLSQLASELASACFPSAPTVSSELVNRQKPSGNSQAAVRQLLWAMVTKPKIRDLGLDGFSAERGLYVTVLQVTNLHKDRKEGVAEFVRPSPKSSKEFAALWSAGDELLAGKSEPMTFAKLYEIWEGPPFGVRKGLLPILGVAYVLSNPNSIFAYREGVYQPELTPVLVDTLLQDPSLIALRWFDTGKHQKEVLQAVASTVKTTISNQIEAEPLSLAKALVKFAFELPKWTHRTSQLSKGAAGVLQLLLTANDPNRLLFIDLPSALSMNGNAAQLKLALQTSLLELRAAYPRMLELIRSKLLDSLKVDANDRIDIGKRCEIVHGISGDLLLDAFALRLTDLESDQAQLEGLISLVTNRPPREWSDHDIDRAMIELARLAMRFRQVELLASVKGRVPSRQSVAMAVSLPDGEQARLRAVDISAHDRSNVSRMAEDIRKFLLDRSSDRDLCLAAMAEAAFALAETESA